MGQAIKPQKSDGTQITDPSEWCTALFTDFDQTKAAYDALDDEKKEYVNNQLPSPDVMADQASLTAAIDAMDDDAKADLYNMILLELDN